MNANIEQDINEAIRRHRCNEGQFMSSEFTLGYISGCIQADRLKRNDE